MLNFKVLMTQSERVLLILFISALALFSPVSADEVDITSQLAITRSGLVFNRATNTYDMTASLTNNSLDTIGAPAKLVIQNISNLGVSLSNGSGTTPSGDPYVLLPLPPGGLLRGGNLLSIVLKFANPSRSQFRFTTKITGVIEQSVEACTVGDWRVSTDASQNSGIILFQYVGNATAAPIGLQQTSSRETQAVNGMFGLGGTTDVEVVRLFCSASGIASYVEDFLRQTSRAVASSLVTPEQGGLLTLSDGTSLIVPPGAVKSAVTITVTAYGTATVLNDGGAKVIELGPDGLVFDVPVRLTVPYLLAGDAQPEAIEASLYSSLNQLEQLGGGEINIGTRLAPTLIDRTNQRLDFSLNHFSRVILQFFPNTIVVPYLPARFLQSGDIILSLSHGRWTPGHAGLVGDLLQADTARLAIPNTPVIESYPYGESTAFCPLPPTFGEGVKPGETQLVRNFLNDVSLGARRPLFNTLTPASRQRIINYAHSREGSCYSIVGVLPTPNFESCVSLVEESYRAGGLSILSFTATFFPSVLYNFTVPVSDIHIAASDTALIPVVVVSRELPIPFVTDYTYTQNSPTTTLSLQSGPSFAQLDSNRVLSLSPQTAQACTIQTVRLLGSTSPTDNDTFDLRVHVTDFQLSGEQPQKSSTATSSRPVIKITATSTCGDKIIKGVLKLDGNVVFSFDDLNSFSRSLDLKFTPASDLSTGNHMVEAVVINENGVRAEFSWSFIVQQFLTVSISPPGAGKVNTPTDPNNPSGGCSTTCTFPASGTVSLTAFVPAPTQAYSFSSWSGDCRGTSPTITINVTSRQSCTANFVRPADSAGYFQVSAASQTSGNVITVTVTPADLVFGGAFFGPVTTVCTVTDTVPCTIKLPPADQLLPKFTGPAGPNTNTYDSYFVEVACPNCRVLLQIDPHPFGQGQQSLLRDIVSRESYRWDPR